jgi:hypothetical protein
VNCDRIIWIMRKKNNIDERSEINRTSQEVLKVVGWLVAQKTIQNKDH